MAVSLQLTIRHLRAFVALAEELHFGRAAASLHLTSSALSQTLRQLEVAVGTTLVRRTTRAVELTPAGRAALEHAQAALPRSTARSRACSAPLAARWGISPWGM